MAKILITDAAYTHVYKMINRWRKNGEHTLIPLSSENHVTFKGEPDLETISWNRKSSLSALTSIRMADSGEGSLDYAIVVFDPAIKKSIDKDSLPAIEKLLDSHIKAFLLLFRELSEIFNKRESGTLIPVLFRSEGDLTDYEKVAAAAFSAAVDNLIQSKSSSFSVKAIDAGNLDFEKTEQLIQQIINDSGKKSKWIKPDTKTNIRTFLTGKRF